MEYIKANKRLIIILLLILAGIAVSVYLVQNRQILKSRAGSDVGEGIRVSNEDGKEVKYEGNNTWRSNTTYIEVSIDDLNQLR